MRKEIGGGLKRALHSRRSKCNHPVEEPVPYPALVQFFDNKWDHQSHALFVDKPGQADCKIANHLDEHGVDPAMFGFAHQWMRRCAIRCQLNNSRLYLSREVQRAWIPSPMRWQSQQE